MLIFVSIRRHMASFRFFPSPELAFTVDTHVYPSIGRGAKVLTSTTELGDSYLPGKRGQLSLGLNAFTTNENGPFPFLRSPQIPGS
jgi:hypothetical protein